MIRIISILIFITLFSSAIFAQNDSGCPTLKITGPPSAIKIGETATFSASLFGNYDEKVIRFNWAVDKGKIIEGQGTTVITVSTEGIEDSVVTAILEIKGLPEKCGTISASETGIPFDPPSIELHFVIEKATEKEIQNEIENLFLRLYNNPSTTAYLLTYGTTSKIEKREKIMKSVIRNGRYDGSRVIFMSSNKEKELRTEIYLVPQGVEPPTP